MIEIDGLTDGQATTALLASEFWNREQGLLVYNIDTFVESGYMNSSQLKGDGFIPCFQGEGDHWSFVKTGSSFKVLEVKEKVRISQYCTLGAYYLKSCGLYEELYESYYNEPRQGSGGERYIAPLYDYLLKRGGEIFISDVPEEHVYVLGTPQELEVFINQYII